MTQMVKKGLISMLLLSIHQVIFAQCSICSKTASQMGEDAARGINSGIIYLAAAPFLILGYIGYRWWRNNRSD